MTVSVAGSLSPSLTPARPALRARGRGAADDFFTQACALHRMARVRALSCAEQAYVHTHTRLHTYNERTHPQPIHLNTSPHPPTPNHNPHARAHTRARVQANGLRAQPTCSQAAASRRDRASCRSSNHRGPPARAAARSAGFAPPAPGGGAAGASWPLWAQPRCAASYSCSCWARESCALTRSSPALFSLALSAANQRVLMPCVFATAVDKEIGSANMMWDLPGFFKQRKCAKCSLFNTIII